MTALTQTSILQPAVGPCLADIKQTIQGKIELTDTGWFSDFLETFAEGGSYLLGGSPGSRKSGLAAQIALDLARNHQSVLIIPTEEPAARVAERCTKLMTGWEADVAKISSANICIEQQVPDIEQLPAYIGRQILSPGGLYHGRNLKLIILDSVQGWGLPSSASRRYERLLEALRLLSSAKITTLLINHVTKRNELAGPRTLEHAVDAVLFLRKTPAARLMFCVKNRFGPADLRNPLALNLDPITLRLNPSPLARAAIATARTYLGGGIGLAEVQASISLAGVGRQGKVMAPGLPKAEVRKISDSRKYAEKVQTWAETELRRAEREEKFLLRRFAGELEQWVVQELEKQNGSRKSINLPAGVVGFRTEPSKLEITDEKVLLDWCKANLPASVKMAETVLKSAVMSHIKTTGECPSGAEIRGDSDHLYIR